VVAPTLEQSEVYCRIHTGLAASYRVSRRLAVILTVVPRHPNLALDLPSLSRVWATFELTVTKNKSNIVSQSPMNEADYADASKCV
jgi:hypothetical protein